MMLGCFEGFYMSALSCAIRALLLLFVAVWTTAVAQNSPSSTALILQIDSAIGPASAEYVLDGLRKAEDEGYALLILEMDTPGGLDSAMRDIIKGILASDVPVVSYVYPAGSRAASAGTYILYASHVAAMSPVSNLGAATPVNIGGSSAPESPFPDSPADESAPADDADNTDAEDAAADATSDSPAEIPADAMKAKMVNDAVAYIKGLAELRGRNIDWAERAVREAVSLTASEALEQNVIDVVAGNVNELLLKIDGMEVEVNGKPVTLITGELGTEYLEPDWRAELLMIITDPSVAYLLMLVGIYGLLLEGYNPGALVPGIVGAICLFLALFAFQVLPVNYAGLGLMLLGVMLIIAEGFVPSFGVLGFGGLAAFVFGSIILMDTDVPGFSISMSIIAGIATAGGLALLSLVYMLMRARNRPVVSGVEGMIGDQAEALEDFDSHGPVFLDGELWQAESPVPVTRGQILRVKAIRGLVAEVEPVSD
jgi:membrane-bound serine protease (ClpP class)